MVDGSVSAFMMLQREVELVGKGLVKVGGECALV